jgi:hypothetical protein
MTMAADARPVVYGPRSCTRLDGMPKAAFRTRSEAQRARRRSRVMDQGIYACEVCGGAYHLGHPSRDTRRQP